MNKYLSIISLKINGLNALIKRHRVAEWIKTHDSYICCLQETHLRTKDLHRLKGNGWKRIFQVNEQEKKQKTKNGVAIPISDKIQLKKKSHNKRPRRPLHNAQWKNP